jgi:hypothetical protein
MTDPFHNQDRAPNEGGDGEGDAVQYACEVLEEIESRLRPFPSHYAGYVIIQRIADRASQARAELGLGVRQVLPTPPPTMSSRDRARAELRRKVFEIMRERGHFDPPAPPAPRNPRRNRRLIERVRLFLRPQSGHTSPVRSANTGPHIKGDLRETTAERPSR